MGFNKIVRQVAFYRIAMKMEANMQFLVIIHYVVENVRILYKLISF